MVQKSTRDTNGKAALKGQGQVGDHEALLHAADSAQRANRSRCFFSALRKSPIAWIPCRPELNYQETFRDLFETLSFVGKRSVPLGVALCMHLHSLMSLACFPLDPVRKRIRENLLAWIAKERLLIANCGSDGATRSRGRTPAAIRVRRTTNGFVASGHKSHVSLAREADLCLLMAETEDGESEAFLVRLRGEPSIEVGPAELGETLEDSGTRSLTFHDTALSDFSHLRGTRSKELAARRGYPHLQRTCFEALIPAVYLGAAQKALAELARAGRVLKLGAGPSLTALDGFLADSGRLVIAHRSSRAVCHQALDELARALSKDLRADAFAEACSLAAAAKYKSGRAAEDIVTGVRRILGTQALAPGHNIERISREVMYGPCHPTADARIEREAGRRLLEGDDEGSDSGVG